MICRIVHAKGYWSDTWGRSFLPPGYPSESVSLGQDLVFVSASRTTSRWLISIGTTSDFRYTLTSRSASFRSLRADMLLLGFFISLLVGVAMGHFP